MTATPPTGLVVTAHPGDFVWRAGGAIALHAKRGYKMKIVCLSYGERGESQFAWKTAAVAMADVKAGRHDEAQRAAEILGADIEFFDAGDYPLRVTYAVDSREQVLRAADVFLEHGVFIETGPHKHAIQQTFFLYVYEPAGNRIEVASAGARLILAPDWQPVTWSEAERKKGQAWGLKTIESFHTHGTPPVVGV